MTSIDPSATLPPPSSADIDLALQVARGGGSIGPMLAGLLVTEIDRLRAEQRELSKGIVALAKLASETPQFDNPLHVWAAKDLRDRVLAEVNAPSGDTP